MVLRLLLLTTILFLSVFSFEARSNYTSSVEKFSNDSTSNEFTVEIVNSTTASSTEPPTEVEVTNSTISFNITLESSNSTEEQAFPSNYSNETTALMPTNESATDQFTTFSIRTSQNIPRTSIKHETTTLTATTKRKKKENINAQKSGEKGKEVLDKKEEDESSLVPWIIVGVIFTIAVIIIIGVAFWAFFKKRKGKKRSKDSQSRVMKNLGGKHCNLAIETGTPITGTPLKTEKSHKVSVQELRSLEEDQTQPSSKVSESNSKSSIIPAVRTPEKETKKERKESKRDETKNTPRESNTKTTVPSSLLKRRSTPEYWKEDSKKSLEAFKPTTDWMDDAPYGYSDGSKGGVKLFKAELDEKKMFVETKEMVAQMTEARAALNRRKPRTEITQSSRKKNIAATLRTKYE